MVKRTVYLGRKRLVIGVATHWAVRVGETDWYEIDGAEKQSKGNRNTVNGKLDGKPYRSSSKSQREAEATHIAGKTVKTDDEIASWNREYLENHRRYDMVVDNCQVYAHDLIQWLTDGVYELTIMESGKSQTIFCEVCYVSFVTPWD